MASFRISKENQFVLDGKEYFRFPLSNGSSRILWTTAPKNLRACPRMELNRLVRALEESHCVVLTATLRRLKKTEVLALVAPVLQFE